jgi:SAM-dependent methyltransferase
MNNYEFCAKFIAVLIGDANSRILDYGCGKGVIVQVLLDRGYEAYGCDVFYHGGDYSPQVPKALWEQRRIVRMPDRP